jgi:hypothetical protein
VADRYGEILVYGITKTVHLYSPTNAPYFIKYSNKSTTTTCFSMHMPSSVSKKSHTGFKKLNSQWSFTVVMVVLLFDELCKKI